MHVTVGESVYMWGVRLTLFTCLLSLLVDGEVAGLDAQHASTTETQHVLHEGGGESSTVATTSLQHP